MTTAKVRWGILGVARINERLLPGFRKAKNAELRAIASRSPERARAAAAAADIPTAHGSYEALLGDPGIDAVYIPLPNSLHAEWTIRAAESGKHVLCEKPLAQSADEAQRAVDFCRERGVQLMDGFMWPHHPRTAQLRQFLDRGGIGAVQRVSGAFTFRLENLDASNIRLNPALGGGSLLDVGCYPVMAVRWAFGAEPVRAFARARYAQGVDIEMSGLLTLADGRIATFDCGFTFPLRGQLEIVGTEGTVWVPDMWVPGSRATFEIRRENRRPEMVVVKGEDQIQLMIEHFGSAIRRGEPVEPPVQEAVRTLRVLDALAKSAQSGKEVDVKAAHRP